MKNPMLRVLSGMHAGAAIDLSSRPQWRVGGDVAAEVFLADEGLPPGGFVLRADDEGNWMLCELDARIDLYGARPAKDMTVRLCPGVRWIAGPVEFLFADGGSGAVMEGDSRARARRHVLWQIDKRRFARTLLVDFRWPLLIALAALSVGTMTAVWLAGTGGTTESVDRQGAWPDYLRRVFPHVDVSIDPVSGVATYTGYVESQGELDRLRSIAAAADRGKTFVKVVPMDVLASHASLLLEGFYASADVRAAGPGWLTVKVHGGEAMKTLSSWDVKGMAERVRRDIPDIRKLDIEILAAPMSTVDLPWSLSGYSVLVTPAMTSFAVDATGTRLFEGSTTGKGTLRRIDRCAIELEAADQSARYRFARDDGRCR